MTKSENNKDEKKRYRSTFYHDGKRHECTGKTQKEADKKAALKKDKLERGEIGISGNMTVEKWAHEWLDTYKRPSVGDGQYKNYTLHIDGVIIPAIGKLTLKNVKDVHLQKLLNSRVGKSKSDVAHLRITIKAIFKRACQSKLISINPAEFLELPAAKDGTHRSITDYERAKILELAETHHAGLWIKTLLYSGMRPGETRALDWRHIDFKKHMICVKQAMKSKTKDIGTPKSESGVREIPIPDELYDALIAAKGAPFEPVFIQPKGGVRHTESSMRKLWLNFKNELDVLMGAKFEKKKAKDGKMRTTKVLSVVAADLTPYCLRHTYCTDLQDAGVPINVAKYLMGHSDISITAKIYTHITDKAIKDAASKINSNNAENVKAWRIK